LFIFYQTIYFLAICTNNNDLAVFFCDFLFLLMFKTIFSFLFFIVVNAYSYAAITTDIITLHRGNGAEPETLDLHKSSGIPEATIQRDLFEGLVTESAMGELIAGAAETWQQSEEGTQWTFQLRKTGKWSDGSPVIAGDFVYALQRAVNPATASEYAFILWPIKNAKAISKGENKEITSLGVKAIDDFTLMITLEHPTPFLLGLLAHHMAYPLHQKSIKKYGAKWTRPNKLVSNGAYQLAEWIPQSKLKLIKNKYYHDAAKVSIDEVVYYPTEDQSAAMKRFRTGELDITEDVPSSQIAWIKENLAQNFHSSPYIGTYYIALNLQKPPFNDNVALRKALSLAINRHILTDKITKGGEIPAMGWVPTGMNQYQSQSMPEAKLTQQERVVLAKKYYQQAGYSKQKPLEVELLYNTSENHKKVAIALTAMWKQVLGAKIKLRNEEWKVYLNSRSQRQFELIRSGWIGDFNDASNFLDLFRSDVGTMNPSAWKNTNYDHLMQHAEKESDTAKRAELMQKAEQILLEDVALIPIYHYTTQHLVSEKIVGWQDNVMDIHPSRLLKKLTKK
jgi:oligopeptide transport system substrate-binding protein